MEQSCKQCGTSFVITDDDLAFYDKVSPVFHGQKELIPPPTLCPECREQRRLAFRNERKLFHRPCDLCGKSIITLYAPEHAYISYCPDCWWKDAWSATASAMHFAAEQPFSRLFDALSRSVPRQSLRIHSSENCDYTNFCRFGRNCYLIFSSLRCQDCLHSTYIDDSVSCVDCMNVDHCELCYDCNYCINCYNVQSSMHCDTCRDSAFLFDCKDCSSCFLSCGLRGKQFVFRNVQCTEREYAEKLNEFHMGSFSHHDAAQTLLKSMIPAVPRHNHLVNCEECTGEFLKDCHRCTGSFDCFGGEDSKWCFRCPYSFRHCQDAFGAYGDSDICYETMNGMNLRNTIATIQCQDIQDCIYCIHCYNSHDLFGCIGLKHKQYCILNKQYTKEEYEALVPKIIEKMRADGEWGEFFPVTMSPFAYNETVAQEYFPMTKAEVVARGWKWRDQTDEMPKVEKILPAAQLPDSIDDIPDDILNWAIECEATKRPFKVIKQELEFYRTMKLPVPRFHPDERHRRRMALRNPRRLWDRECAKCKKPIATSYSPERPEIVYCESCYLAAVY